MEIQVNPYKTSCKFWCSVCDQHLVDSTNKQTGRFYQVFGHEFHTGDYTSVFIAVCPLCDRQDTLKDVNPQDAFLSNNHEMG